MTWYTGTCEGGPLDGRKLIHAEGRYIACIDAAGGKLHPGGQGPSKQIPEVKFGTYLWFVVDETVGRWMWNE